MKKGVVVKLYGDQQIAGAIADGMAQALKENDVEVVDCRIRDEKVQRSLLRVAVNNTKTDEDYACMTAKARGEYEYLREHGGRIYNAILGTWGLLWYCIFGVFDHLSAWNREPGR